jgi:hypothetical protein
MATRTGDLNRMAKGFRSIAAAQANQKIEIAKPTIEQAHAFLVKVVAEADRRGLKSPTMEAIRVIIGYEAKREEPVN